MKFNIRGTSRNEITYGVYEGDDPHNAASSHLIWTLGERRPYPHLIEVFGDDNIWDFFSVYPRAENDNHDGGPGARLYYCVQRVDIPLHLVVTYAPQSVSFQ